MRLALVRMLLAAMPLVCMGSFAVPTVHAHETYGAHLPCRVSATNELGSSRICITCHNNVNGGEGCPSPPCFNDFGEDFFLADKTWGEALARLDSDGDGYTNGEELGDPAGAWVPGMPSTCGCASRPGFASCGANGNDSRCTPGDTDADGDGYCCRGRDLDMNGDCRGPSEHDTSFDCDEMNMSVHSGATEICSNLIDNDCDGLPTLMDPDCASVVDRDGDGFCGMGRDLNGDRNCIGPGENTSDVDCDDTQTTVYPGATENCADGLDNNCDGMTDRADPLCTSDVDADMDGYCPVGRDFMPANGHCNDPGELEAGTDCDDSNATVHSGAVEDPASGLCADGLDNDCDGLADRREPDCASVYDLDGDGYCGAALGESCADGSMPGDCNDDDRTRNPGATELCENGPIDDDCDGLASLDDPDCAGYLDADGDRYCAVGFDMNRDGFCLGDEVTGAGDCDDTNDALSPAATEICTDGLDNDCDGVADALDRGQCDAYRDHDRDGFCLVGADDNGDGDCDDPGEQREPIEQPGDESSPLGTDLDPTVYPGAPENCLDRKDNDLDGMIDEGESCTRDVDADGDGYCPIGQDLNGDGDCLDAGENVAVSDCNDADPAVNPGASEMCLGIVDMDCDGDWALDDDDCVHLVDRDRDGFCGMGIDDTGDGDCNDEGEDRFGMDCDDLDPRVNPRAVEVCDDGVDNDCDGDVDYADPSCTCTTNAQCDDGDPCTADVCGADSHCAWTPDPTCGDGGFGDGGVVPGGAGCGCRAVSTGGGALAGLGWMGLALLLTLRRRRRASSARRGG